MNAKEFATKYAGYDVYCQGRLARIIGYSGETEICIEVYNDPRDMSWPIGMGTFNYGELLVKDAQYGWWTDIESLTLVDRPIVNVKPYPHKCSVCGRPARIIGRNKLCSNTKCKSNRVVKSIYKTSIKFMEPVKESDKLPFCTPLSSGRMCYPEAWQQGGCILCGGSTRDELTFAHANCWNGMLTIDESQEIFNITGKVR